MYGQGFASAMGLPSAQRIRLQLRGPERSEGLVSCKPKLARHPPEHDIDAREYGGEAGTWDLADPTLEDASIEGDDL